jgi:hypothetical protein
LGAHSPNPCLSVCLVRATEHPTRRCLGTDSDHGRVERDESEMMHHHDDLTLSPVEQSLWLGIQASMAESDSRSTRLRRWRDGELPSNLAPPSHCLGMARTRRRVTLTGGTFTGHLLVATVGLVIQGVSLHNLLRPPPKRWASGASEGAQDRRFSRQHHMTPPNRHRHRWAGGGRRPQELPAGLGLASGEAAIVVLAGPLGQPVSTREAIPVGAAAYLMSCLETRATT